MTMTINEFTDLAKESILTNGHIEPAFFVQLDAGRPKIIIMQGDSKTAYDRAVMCFLAGRRFATNDLKKKKISGIGYASQIQRAGRSGAMAKGFMIQTDTPQEVQISVIDLQTEKQECIVYEIIRDGQQKPVDLLQASLPSSGTFQMALPCFLRGIRTAKQPYSVAIHAPRRIYEDFMREVADEGR